MKGGGVGRGGVRRERRGRKWGGGRGSGKEWGEERSERVKETTVMEIEERKE